MNRRIFLRRFLIFLLMAAGLLTPLSGQENLRCYLLTIGPGEALYSWFGHTGIIIEDDERGRFYDFGNFSFASDNFYRNFAMGRLVYLKIGVSSNSYLNYIVRENRNVTIQQLNLSQESIRAMKEDLEFNIRPENNTYLYHHYHDNCSTRPRDILDRALEGQLKAATDIPSGESYRSMFRSRTSRSFFPDWLLSLLQGRTIDNEIKVWDKMFLPDELMKELDSLTIETERGREKAVLSEAVLAESSENVTVPEKVPGNGVQALFWGLASGIMILGLWRTSRNALKPAAVAAKIILTLILTAVSLFGLAFWFVVFLTDHDVARQNINILLIHPLYLAAAVVMIRDRARGWFLFWKIQGGLWLLMLAVNTAFWHQGNLRTTLFFLPLILCVLLGQIGSVGLKSRKPS